MLKKTCYVANKATKWRIMFSLLSNEDTDKLTLTAARAPGAVHVAVVKSVAQGPHCSAPSSTKTRGTSAKLRRTRALWEKCRFP